MSAFIIYYQDGAKHMRPVNDETEYRLVRDTEHNRRSDKHHMVQMNYSCLPNDDGTLKGSTRMSRSVGMDIDFDPKAADYEQKMASVPDLVMGKKDELGLLMLERSANKGYHIAFKRKPELSQEENLKWASQLLGVQYDKGAKDITRVFFTPPCEKLLFVDADLFDNDGVVLRGCGGEISSSAAQQTNTISTSQHTTSTSTPQHTTSYLGIPYADIIRKRWAMYND